MEKLVIMLSALIIMWETSSMVVENVQRNELHVEIEKHNGNLMGKKSYRWRTGNWGICYSGKGPNSCGQGKRERPVWCTDAEDGRVPEFLCDPATEPEKAKGCFTACRHHKDKLKWEVGPWGPCSEAEEEWDATRQAERADSTGAYGSMQRNVSCILVSQDDLRLRLTVDEENCLAIAKKPDTSRLCNIPRPQDCVVTEFTAWSSCHACLPNTNQTRTRTVLVAPKNGGRSCPPLSETRPCKSGTECPNRSFHSAEEHFRLKIFDWSKCEIPNSFGSGEESEYNGGMRGGPGSISFPMMDVSVSAESSEKQTIFQAQVGYQTREVACKDGAGATVDLGLCNAKPEELPLRLRSCVVSRDCVVSDWSAWTKVTDGCSESPGKTRPEVYERKRQVTRLPEGDGRSCPHLTERKEAIGKDAPPLCEHKYKRIPSKWSECMVTSGADLVKVGCGGGIQLRTISCVSVSSGRPVEDDLCITADTFRELPTVQRCEVPCPRDCVVGEWGKWGSCSREFCSGNWTGIGRGHRLRTRDVLVQPSPRGVPCPATKEVQPCDDVRCYRWSVGHWGTCVLSSAGKCGPGVRKRSVRCVDVAKAAADESLCDYEERPQETEPCLMPCPFDCVLSPWSDWSPCSHPCSGRKMVALRQRNRTVIAPPGPGGRKCPNPDELTEMQPCNTHSCHGYSWLVLPWQSCTSLAEDGPAAKGGPPVGTGVSRGNGSVEGGLPEEAEVGDCGAGVRSREIWCVEDNGIRVADAMCLPLEKPPEVEECRKECPVDCLLSPWAEWSPCPQECVPDASNEVRDGEVAPTQSRSRIVLRSPVRGGAPCRHLDEFRPCPLSAARCKHYKWQVSEWSECQLPGKLECGQGFRTRGVWCSKNHRTSKVSPTFCVEHDGPPPVLSEKCTVDCLHRCVLSEWSAWSKCSSSCGGATVRRRQLLGHSGSRKTCLNGDSFPLRESKGCRCELFTPLADERWTDCVLEQPLEKITANGRTTHDTCGSGMRYKRNACVDATGNIVEPSLCEMKSSLLEEPCIVPCPVDCVQSPWSDWGECSAVCGFGFQNRTRQVIQEARDGGRPCGASAQTKICGTACSNFKWTSSGYTQCSLQSHDEFRGCGAGDQYRTVRCLDYSRSGEIARARDEFCDSATRPANVSPCHLSCPGDCVVSPWSSWSDCDTSCDGSKQRRRTRVLLRAPSHSGKNCPSLIQAQSCEINVTCFTYDWKTSPYGSCLPLGGSPCGEGVQTRAVYCERSDGRAVSDRFCDPNDKPDVTEKWCYLECPVDCEVTPWSRWDSSECTCGDGNGYEHRKRSIATSPSSSGRPCPTAMRQRKPCRAEPCYRWTRGPWSACVLEGSDCGYGTSYRNVSCTRGNVEVDLEECFASSGFRFASEKPSEAELAGLDLNAATGCYFPCQSDCEVSEWSEWSHCHRDCQENRTGGYQTRSRAILKEATSEGESCPSSLWETRPCNAGPCLTFEWSVEDGVIRCRRSDGTFVVGGCDERRKPCVRNCSEARNSRCSSGKCRCPDGYRSVFESDSGSRLVGCVAVKEGISVNQKLAHPDTMADDEEMLRTHLLYLPNDELNIWMFAMIGIGCLFVVFVAVSFYLMCHNSNSSSQENGTQALNVSKP